MWLERASHAAGYGAIDPAVATALISTGSDLLQTGVTAAQTAAANKRARKRQKAAARRRRKAAAKARRAAQRAEREALSVEASMGPSDDGLSTGAIAGLGVGALALAGLVYYIARGKKAE